MPGLAPRAVTPLTRDQLDALTAAAPPSFRVALVLGAGAGLRQGEATGLAVDRVDFMRRTIRVDAQLVTPNTGAPHLGPPKTASSIRTVPVAGFVVDAIAAHIAEHGPGESGLILHTRGARSVGTGSGICGVLWHRRPALPGSTSTICATRSPRRSSRTG